VLRARKPRGSRPAPGRRVRLDLSFVGTGFRGWQSQAKGATVQDALEAALRSIQVGAGRPVGCSRTDSGVHARRFTAHVDLEAGRRPDQLLKGLNAALPPEVRVHRAGDAPGEFHARFGCAGKTYRYFLHLGPVVPPPLAPFVWMWQGPLDEGAMREAAALFPGEHDFSAFTTAEGRERTTLRTLTACSWERRGPLFVLTVEGPSFLHRMVRCIAGALAAAGTGRLDDRHLSRALAGDTSVLLHALPAQALHLWEVRYPEGGQEPQPYGQWPELPSWVLES